MSLNEGGSSEKCNVRPFLCCVDITECTYTNLHGQAYHTPSLLVYGVG